MTADIQLDAFGLPGDPGADEDGTVAGPGALTRTPAPLGQDAGAVQKWFDEVVEVEAPLFDGSLAAVGVAAEIFARMAKAENTRRPIAPRCAPGAPGA